MSGSKISYGVVRKSFDADFHNILKEVNFSTTPREVVTIQDCLDHQDHIDSLGKPLRKWSDLSE